MFLDHKKIRNQWQKYGKSSKYVKTQQHIYKQYLGQRGSHKGNLAVFKIY